MKECVGLKKQEDRAAPKVQEGQVQQAPTTVQRREQIQSDIASSVGDVELQRILDQGFEVLRIKDASHDAEATSKGKGTASKNSVNAAVTLVHAKTTEQPKQDGKHPQEDNKTAEGSEQDDVDPFPPTETGWGASVGREVNIDDFSVCDDSAIVVPGGPSSN